MEYWVAYLPHVNASLNSLSTLLLIAALLAIKSRREILHKQLMLGAFGVSAVFLAGYLTYHAYFGSKPFPYQDYPAVAAYSYYLVLATHAILAVSVPFLTIWAIFLGLNEKREAHRRVVRWAYPIWLYVSATGVLVYFMLYWWFPPLTASN